MKIRDLDLPKSSRVDPCLHERFTDLETIQVKTDG